MSFEGYYQLLCEQGHYREEDTSYHSDPEEIDCPYCSARTAWMNLVDETNGAFCGCSAGNKCFNSQEGRAPEGEGCEHCDRGRIDGHVFLEWHTPPVTEVCNLGHSHIMEQGRYKIPEGEGHKIERGEGEG